MRRYLGTLVVIVFGRVFLSLIGLVIKYGERNTQPSHAQIQIDGSADAAPPICKATLLKRPKMLA